MTNPGERLIDHALSLRWTDVDAAAQAAAKTFLHDSLCVGVAGRNAPFADAVLSAARAWGEGGRCSVLGRADERLPAPQAAFVNAFQIHSQEFDCVHEPAVVHPLATIVATLFAEVERSGPYTGEAVLTALVAGVDVSAALGVAASDPLRFFRPATAGIFGCVAALISLTQPPRHVALDAFGYALSFASGSMQAHVEGKATLPVQMGQAARNAVSAMDLARAGLPGPLHAIDGKFGYLPLFEGRFDLDDGLADLGRRFRIAEVSWKPYPTGRAAQGCIVATEMLMRDHGLTPATLERLTYSAPPIIRYLVGRPAMEGMSVAYARLCAAWLSAVTLMRGRPVGLDDFTEDSLADPAVLDLARRIEVVVNDNPDPAAFAPAEAVARFTDGREARLLLQAQFGAPDWPLSRDQHMAKAAACLRFGGLPHVHAPLAALIDDFELLEDAARAFRLAAGREDA
ncbi:MmgE/PrpD family protein [Brevundimonas sp. LPMIX5]|uniref:MmgE/PrpD family protein n=1 Tax=Brevundimonas sp. LPMIX5 TaxID=2305887 RepID=UPI000E66C100|nr:MmgE/PrpD family protein [Brevundimonas sp. LPMIX5]RIJ68344.1 MmgE/PrpD family protein [Brevundimonas sp. LPMIX5]